MLCAEYIKHKHTFPIIGFNQLLDSMPSESFQYISKDECKHLAEIKRSGNGDTLIGNKYQSGIEQFLNQEFDYEAHIPEKTIQAEELDRYMTQLIQSQTLFL